MKNAMLTGIVAGMMGFATMAEAREAVPVELTVEIMPIAPRVDDEVSILVDEANRVTQDITAAQDTLAELQDSREGYARRMREMVRRMRKLNRGDSREVIVAARRFMSELDREIRNIENTISDLQETLARLANAIRDLNPERDTSDGVPRETPGEPAR